jgi:hypothetical protein
MTGPPTPEHARLEEADAGSARWRRWGPYLSDRAWGTVREDYSPGGTAWDAFPHDHARSRAYRWNEDGLAGLSDERQYVCLAVTLWNGRDAILKERLFGLTGPEGNHGEDVKELYHHLDATPTHSHLRFLYHYPQREFPYNELVTENRRRGPLDPEFELADTTALEQVFDVVVSYAKNDPDDILWEISVTNRADTPATCHILPTVWFRNTWSWGYAAGPMGDVATRPHLTCAADGRIEIDHPALGRCTLEIDQTDDVWFTENETNRERLWGLPNASPFVKDAFHRRLVEGDETATNPRRIGTKAAFIRRLELQPGAETRIRLRLRPATQTPAFADFDEILDRRRREADEFHASLLPAGIDNQLALIHRSAVAGMIWTKQLYYFDIEQWLEGDPAGPRPPVERRGGRNRDWRHLNNFDVLSMPDGWEYPWFAAWDLAFHAVTLAAVDPSFAKAQLEVMTREWYMHPNGQLPAYEWAFGDVNPPVHAWAARRVYEIDGALAGRPDRAVLERVVHKLLLNFTWWVNRKDADGNNVFQGGFLGLDNISVFDRSAPLPGGGRLDQSDGTAWMAFFTLEMLAIALELAKNNPVYQDLATKFFEHFLSIGTAMSDPAHCLWDTEDRFFYDALRLPDGSARPLRVRSMLGLIPLLAVTVIDADTMARMPEFSDRMHWFLHRKPHLSGNVARIDESVDRHHHLAAILDEERLRSVLRYLLDEKEFLSPYGIRSLSRHHRADPFETSIDGQRFRVEYAPGESSAALFGGNSNWRGPVWFPINVLLIEALDRFHSHFGDAFEVECPTGSGRMVTLAEVANDIARRLVGLFLVDDRGSRPFAGRRPAAGDALLFHEFFHGDDGRGLGASHQTGWTGSVADLIRRLAHSVAKPTDT